MPELIRPKVNKPRADWATHGEQTRRALDILRRANGEKLSTREITLRVMRDRGLDTSRPKLGAGRDPAHEQCASAPTQGWRGRIGALSRCLGGLVVGGGSNAECPGVGERVKHVRYDGSRGLEWHGVCSRVCGWVDCTAPHQ